VYLYTYFKSFFTFKIDYLGLLFGGFFIIVFLAGNFFGYASIAIYMVILRERIIMSLNYSKV